MTTVMLMLAYNCTLNIMRCISHLSSAHATARAHRFFFPACSCKEAQAHRSEGSSLHPTRQTGGRLSEVWVRGMLAGAARGARPRWVAEFAASGVAPWLPHLISSTIINEANSHKAIINDPECWRRGAGAVRVVGRHAMGARTHMVNILGHHFQDMR